MMPQSILQRANQSTKTIPLLLMPLQFLFLPNLIGLRNIWNQIRNQNSTQLPLMAPKKVTQKVKQSTMAIPLCLISLHLLILLHLILLRNIWSKIRNLNFNLLVHTKPQKVPQRVNQSTEVISLLIFLNFLILPNSTLLKNIWNPVRNQNSTQLVHMTPQRVPLLPKRVDQSTKPIPQSFLPPVWNAYQRWSDFPCFFFNTIKYIDHLFLMICRLENW